MTANLVLVTARFGETSRLCGINRKNGELFHVIWVTNIAIKLRARSEHHELSHFYRSSMMPSLSLKVAV